MAEPKTGPVRTCLACGRKADKKELLRFIVVKDVVRQDYTGKADGRGAYCCDSRKCLRKFCSNTKRLSRSFRSQVCGSAEELARQIKASRSTDGAQRV